MSPSAPFPATFLQISLREKIHTVNQACLRTMQDVSITIVQSDIASGIAWYYGDNDFINLQFHCMFRCSAVPDYSTELHFKALI